MSRPIQSSICLRVAGSPQIGFGHVRRSWTLASQLQADGWRVQCVATSAEAAAWLARAGLPVVVESHPDSLDRIIQVLQEAVPPALCLVDDPTCPSEALRTLRRWAPVACVDDTGDRAVPVDLVINGSAGAEQLVYRGTPETRYLLGPQYMLLRSAFAQRPNRPTARPGIQRALVLVGGGEQGRVAGEMLQLVLQALPAASVDVVVGPFGTPFALVEDQRVRVHRYPEDMRALMLGADLAISGGGQTAYELAATATPTIGVQLAENQALNLRGLAEAGTLINLGAMTNDQSAHRLAQMLHALADDPQRRDAMAACGLRLVDGLGAPRVVSQLALLAVNAAVVR